MNVGRAFFLLVPPLSSVFFDLLSNFTCRASVWRFLAHILLVFCRRVGISPKYSLVRTFSLQEDRLEGKQLSTVPKWEPDDFDPTEALSSPPRELPEVEEKQQAELHLENPEAYMKEIVK